MATGHAPHIEAAEDCTYTSMQNGLRRSGSANPTAGGTSPARGVTIGLRRLLCFHA
jgi:hypothetical protein